MDRIGIQWIVENVSDSIEFYTEKLGFNIDWIGEGPSFAMVSRGNMTIMLRQLKKEKLPRPNRIPFIRAGWHTNGKEAWDAYVWVENADKIYEEFMNKDVSIIKDIQNTEYGNRDFEIEDCDGYILCFGHSLK